MVPVFDVSVNWAINKNWQTNVFDTLKVTAKFTSSKKGVK